MPSIYTHQKFGNEVMEQLPKELQDRLRLHWDVFSIGFQGPDIFFFYHPLSWGAVPQYGNRMHQMSGTEFFGHALERYYQLPHGTEGERQLRAAAGSYLLGVLCHYTLDSTCHKFIDEVDASGVTSHAELEGDYDRRLIAREGRDPVKENLTGQFRPSREAAEAIAVFYPEMSAPIVKTALSSCVVLQTLLRCPHDGKRNFLYGALKLLGKYDSFQPHIMNKEPDPACQEAEDHLDELYAEALPRAVRLVTEMAKRLTENAVVRTLGECCSYVTTEDYARNFGGVIPED